MGRERVCKSIEADAKTGGWRREPPAPDGKKKRESRREGDTQAEN